MEDEAKGMDGVGHGRKGEAGPKECGGWGKGDGGEGKKREAAWRKLVEIGQIGNEAEVRVCGVSGMFTIKRASRSGFALSGCNN